MRDHRLKVFKIDTLKKVSGKEAKLQNDKCSCRDHYCGRVRATERRRKNKGFYGYFILKFQSLMAVTADVFLNQWSTKKPIFLHMFSQLNITVSVIDFKNSYFLLANLGNSCRGRSMPLSHSPLLSYVNGWS